MDERREHGRVSKPSRDETALDQLLIPADLDLLGDVRAWVRPRAAAGGFSNRDLGDLDLAVTEAVSNVIRHAYGEDSRHQVSIRAGLEQGRFVICILDTGPPFAGAADCPDLDSPQQGGYGLHLISAVMDEATWSRLPDGRNELRLARVCPEGRE